MNPFGLLGNKRGRDAASGDLGRAVLLNLPNVAGSLIAETPVFRSSAYDATSPEVLTLSISTEFTNQAATFNTPWPWVFARVEYGTGDAAESFTVDANPGCEICVPATFVKVTGVVQYETAGLVPPSGILMKVSAALGSRASGSAPKLTVPPAAAVAAIAATGNSGVLPFPPFAKNFAVFWHPYTIGNVRCELFNGNTAVYTFAPIANGAKYPIGGFATHMLLTNLDAAASITKWSVSYDLNV